MSPDNAKYATPGHGHLDFCKEFAYPREVEEILRRIADAMDPLKVRSVLLHGSTSRGEFSWKASGGNITLLSDMEFVIVSRSGISSAERMKMRHAMDSIALPIRQSSPAFGFDYSYITASALTRYPRFFINFEKKHCGKIIFGEDIRHLIPDISLENLDFGDLNEVLVWRLWEILVNVPAEFAGGQSSSEEADSRFYHALNRNALDLLTWALPHEGILECGFRGRLGRLGAVAQSPSRCINLLRADLEPFLARALGEKLNLTRSMSTRELFIDTMGFMHRAIVDLVMIHGKHAAPAISRTLGDEIIKLQSNTMTDRSLKRRLKEILQLSPFILKGGCPLKAAGWFSRPKMLMSLAIMAGLLESMRARMTNDSGASEAALSQAESMLRDFQLDDTHFSPEAGYTERWLRARHSFAAAFTAMIWGNRNPDKVRDYMEKVGYGESVN